MSFTSTWTEELVAEWLQIEGFLVETRLPGGPAGKGGRFEPDVVGARVRDGTLAIRHCEVTAWLNGKPQETGAKYADKFSLELCRQVTAIFSGRFGVGMEQVKYEKWIITGGYSKPMGLAVEAHVPGVCLLTIDEFIRQEVLRSLDDWQTRNRTQKGTWPTPPQGLWLLQLMDYMRWKKLIVKGEGHDSEGD